ncbi:hypothetical protein [Janthinobacterium sp. CG_S6]|uniref:hypothetical protein n=1 Tax=unclassified Janthinobacterium TaxID=2610881 RepID=UPI00035D8441|nr:hypothetical protein [Janthinobacterium sp. CG_S6]
MHAPQLGDLQLQVLDLGGSRRQLGLHVQQCVALGGDGRVAFAHQALARQQQRLQGVDVVGQVG